MISVSNDEAVARLETAAVPYVSRIEELQSAVASILDEAAIAVDKAL